MNWWKWVTLGIIALGLFVLGFFTYKWTHKPEVITEIKYIKGETIHDSIPVPYPDIEYIEPDTVDVIKRALASGRFSALFPQAIHDTLLVTSTDTSLVLHDWASLRHYKDTLLNDDTLGFLAVSADVQYNRMFNLGYTLTPVQKTVTNEVKTKHRYVPYLGAGIITNPAVVAQAGLFIDNWGFAGQYQYDWKLQSHNGGLLVIYKFDY
jgi:hypothetical protein